MRVSDLMDILKDYPRDHEVVLAFVSSPGPASPDLSVDTFVLDGVLERAGDDDEDDVIWLIGGNPEDVEDLYDALEADVVDDDE
jgi:hypothetical protein